jgi:hypothetical protein
MVLIGFLNRFASHFLLFQDALTYWHVIALCHSQQTMALQSCIPSLRTWVVCEMVVKMLSLIVISCVLNQSRKHWLLGDALQFIITKTCEVHDEVGHVVNLDGIGDLEANVFNVELA